MMDRRFDLRVPVQEPVSVRWMDSAGETQKAAAVLADISRSGALMRTQHPVKVGTALGFRYDDQDFSGRVMHCVSEPSGYALGIEFDAGCRWSPRLVKVK